MNGNDVFNRCEERLEDPKTKRYGSLVSANHVWIGLGCLWPSGGFEEISQNQNCGMVIDLQRLRWFQSEHLTSGGLGYENLSVESVEIHRKIIHHCQHNNHQPKLGVFSPIHRWTLGFFAKGPSATKIWPCPTSHSQLPGGPSRPGRKISPDCSHQKETASSRCECQIW